MISGVLKYATTIFVPIARAKVSKRNRKKFHTHIKKANLHRSYVNMEQEVLGRTYEPYAPSDV
jgi:hypothetical protein